MSIPELHELVAISRFAGAEVLLAQGGGGNTSVKSADGARMWIKASGVRLAEVEVGRGCLETDLPALVAVMRDPDLCVLSRAEAHATSVRRIQATTRSAGQARPSLETGFHAVLGRVVLHTHPVYVNAFTCMEDGEAALAEAFPEPVAWVRYEPPGYALGVAVDRAAAAHQEKYGQPPKEILLSKHGLIASAANGAEAIAITSKLVRAGEAYFGPLPADACASETPPKQLIRWAGGLERELRKHFSGVAVRAATRTTLLHAADEPEQWLTAGPLVPDDVVYGGVKVREADAACPPSAWLASEMASPSEKMIVAVAGLGVVLAGPHPKFLDALEENLLAHVLVRQLIARRGRARPLPADEASYLLAMESEHYRQAVAGGGT